MYRPSRTRRILKWTGAGLSLVVLLTWAVSLWGMAGMSFGQRGLCEIEFGVIRFGVADYAQSRWPTLKIYESKFFANGTGFLTPPISMVKGQWSTKIHVPFWFPFLCCAIPTAWLWHRDRRRNRPGCRLRCGYDLTGNASGVCSECGERTVPARPA